VLTTNILHTWVLTMNDLYYGRYKTIPTWKSVNLYDPSNSMGHSLYRVAYSSSAS
jgi:hypothetical protein